MLLITSLLNSCFSTKQLLPINFFYHLHNNSLIAPLLLALWPALCVRVGPHVQMPAGHSRVQCAISEVNGSSRAFEVCRWHIVWVGRNNHSLMNMDDSSGGERGWEIGGCLWWQNFSHSHRGKLGRRVTCAARIMQSRLSGCQIYELTDAIDSSRFAIATVGPLEVRVVFGSKSFTLCLITFTNICALQFSPGDWKLSSPRQS